MLKHKTFYFIIAAGLFEREWNANRESNTTQKKLTSNHILPSLSSKEKAKVKKRNIKFTQIVFNVKVTTCALSEKDLENHKFACFSYGGVEKETEKKAGWIVEYFKRFAFCLGIASRHDWSFGGSSFFRRSNPSRFIIAATSLANSFSLTPLPHYRYRTGLIEIRREIAFEFTILEAQKESSERLKINKVSFCVHNRIHCYWKNSLN